MFINPPESLKSNVAEEPGCHRVERTCSFKDTKFVLLWKL